MCIFCFTLVDAQVAKCKSAVVMLSGAGNGSITTAGFGAGSSGYVSLSLSKGTFDCSNVGPNVVTLTATAANGKTATCTGVVTIKDGVKPVARCKTASIALSEETTISPSVVDDVSTDICGIASYALTPNVFNCSNAGANSVTLSVTDVNNNTKTCTSVIYITCSN